MTKKVIIIGSGIGGLATANLLAKAGYDVHVYEKNNQLGGRAGILKKKGFTFDTGPSWYLMPKVFDHYFELLDHDTTDFLNLIKLTPAYKVFYEHTDPITITGDLMKDARTFEAVEPGSGKWLKRYVADSSKIYELSLKHFLYSNFETFNDFLKKDIVKRGVRMLRLASTPIDRYLSRSIHDLRLKQILEYPMVFLGTSPFDAPAIYSLMSALDFEEGVYYPKGGLRKIVEALITLGKQLKVTYHKRVTIQKIVVKNGQAIGVKVGRKTIAADIVISNADLHHTETKLLNPADRSYPAGYWTKQQAGPSALLLYLGIKGHLPKLEHHNLLFVDDWKENFDAIYGTKTVPDNPSIYICKPSASDTTVAPKRHENVFVLVPLPSGITLSDKKRDQLADAYLDQIERMTKTKFKQNILTKTVFGPDEFGRQFNAWENTALGPSHLLRQSAFLRTKNKSKKVKNLYYVGGSTVPGVGIPMCLISAELIYKRLAGDKSGGQIKAVEQLVEAT